MTTKKTTEIDELKKMLEALTLKMNDMHQEQDDLKTVLKQRTEAILFKTDPVICDFETLKPLLIGAYA